MFIDSHCHLFYEDFRNDVPAVITRAQQAGVDYFIVPATNHETAEEAMRLAEQYPSIFFAAGFHPLDLKYFSEKGLERIEQLLKHPKAVAVGEIGIDYFYDTSPRDVQKEIFLRQIEMAIRLNFPIIVHTRDSVQDAVDIVTSYAGKHPEWLKGKKRGVFHCFTGTAAQAEVLFDIQFLVSYPGPVTFKKSSMPEVIQQIGLKNIMVETDAPFLTPVPFRGKRNEPMHVPLIAQKIADTLEISINEVAATTTQNALELFRILR